MLPEENKLREIAQELESGFCVYLHKVNCELIALPDEDRFSDMDTDFFREDMKKIKSHKSKYLKFVPMSSRDSFRMMEAFINEVTDNELQERLALTLRRKSPFANFNAEIDESGPFREKWFQFKTLKYFEWVKEQWEDQHR
jgi:hypothetical protein